MSSDKWYDDDPELTKARLDKFFRSNPRGENMKRQHRDRKSQPDAARTMSFEKAKRFVMPFGEGAGRSLDSIAESDEGLMYLDSLVGQKPPVYEDLSLALKAYLSDPGIKSELAKLLDA